jgi:tetratricopeptide (TPR) repeat protein
MTSNVAGLVREGVAAFKAGRKDEARKLLTRAAELDERNEEAWLWLSAVVDNLENQQICLENVLAINPSNKRALQGLDMIKQKLAKQQDQAGAAPPSPPQQPGQSTAPYDLSIPIPGSEAPPVAMPPQTDPFAAAGEEAGFHGSGRQVDLPSQDEYDAWVDGLNLGGAVEPAPAQPSAQPPAQDPFNFDGGPFQQDVAPADPFGDFDQGDGYAQAEAPPANDPFSVDPGYGDMRSPGQEQPDPAPMPQADPFALPQHNTLEGYADPAEAVDDFDALIDDEGDYSSASPFFDAESEVGVSPEEAAAEAQMIRLLQTIPAEIKPSHLPGKGPLYPRSLLIGLVAAGGGVAVSFVLMIILIVSRIA